MQVHPFRIIKISQNHCFLNIYDLNIASKVIDKLDDLLGTKNFIKFFYRAQENC